MYKKYFIILLIFSVIEIQGNFNYFSLKSLRNFAKELMNKTDTHQVTKNLPSEIDSGVSLELGNFLMDIQELLEVTKEQCAGLSGHISLWDDFQELLVKHLHENNKTEGLLNHWHTKTYIFYSSAVYFMQQLPTLRAEDSQYLEFYKFCEGFEVLKDNKLLFGEGENYRNFSEDLSEYFAEMNRIWESHESDKFCGKTPSLRSGLFKYFKIILKIHIRRFLISYFGHAVCDRTTAKIEINLYDKFIEESKIFTSLMSNAIRNFEHPAFDCSQEPGKNSYVELTGLIRTKLINERDLSFGRKVCSKNCDLGIIGRNLKTQKCPKALSCRYISSSFDVCISENSSRAYEWFQDYEGNVYGKSQKIFNKNVCQGSSVSIARDYVWYSISYCDYCVCTCREKPRPGVVAVISFRDQVSDIYDNWVVVAVRFIKKDSWIHIQIKEGQLLPYGGINSTRWREIEWIDYSEENESFYLINSTGGPDQILFPGKDYGEAEEIIVDDMKAPQGFLITGVRFRFIWDYISRPRLRHGVIRLQIQVTRSDFLRGKLEVKSSRWVDGSWNLRSQLALEDSDDPSKAPGELQWISSDVTVKFQASSLEKDAGQSTVPFFDSREVGYEPAVPLQGIGMLHRGNEGFGGFLALRVFDSDVSDVFQEFI